MVLDILNLHIKKEEIVGLVGNNGQGKSTLLKLILDLAKPTQGRVLINGRDVRQDEEWKKNTGSYLDESYLINFLKVEEYFDFIAFLNGLGSAILNDRLARFAPFFREEIMKKNKFISDYSTGGKAKIGIAAAFLANPSLVILDEPFSHLDPSSQDFLKLFIKEYASSQGATFIISSHQIEAIAEISTRVLLLDKGCILNDISDSNEALPILKRYFF
ncbi:MAG: ABC transporter ATP-binding protein [Agriterribacter sp.]